MYRVIFLGLLLLCSCGEGDQVGKPSSNEQSSVDISCDSPYQYDVPVETGDGIPTDDINTKEINADLIMEMASLMHCGEFDHQLNSVLISINGDLVLEKYFPGFVSVGNRTIVDYDKDSLHTLASVKKSIQSALVGVALEQDLLTFENTRLYDYFSDYTDVDWFEPYVIDGEEYKKADITLRDLLTMSAGFEWDELSVHYGHADNSLTHMNDAEDGFEHLFQLPLVTPPGRDFVYSTGVADVIAEIIKRSTGQEPRDFASAEFFQPLGIDDFYWDKGLSIRPRDMLKFGQLYLNQGKWGETQILSPEWVAQSLEKAFDFGGGQRMTGYGYQWWHNGFTIDGVEYDASAALGYGGQQILIFEEFDMVVVFTAAEYPAVHNNTRTPYMWLSNYIVPAIVNSSAQ